MFDSAENPLACLLCDAPSTPLFVQVIPDYREDSDTLLGCPLCPRCAAISPPLFRMHRCISLVKKMAGKKRDGRWRYALTNPPRRQIHPR